MNATYPKVYPRIRLTEAEQAAINEVYLQQSRGMVGMMVRNTTAASLVRKGCVKWVFPDRFKCIVRLTNLGKAQRQLNDKHMYKEMNPGSLLAALGTDADKWTNAFMELTATQPLTTLTMKGWFEQALRAGHDAGYQAGFNDKRKKPKYMET